MKNTLVALALTLPANLLIVTALHESYGLNLYVAGALTVAILMINNFGISVNRKD